MASSSPEISTPPEGRACCVGGYMRPSPPFTPTLRRTPPPSCPLPACTLNMKLRTLLPLGLLVVATLCLATASPASYFEDGAYDGEYTSSLSEKDGAGFDDYSENDLENILDVAEKRGCVRRGGNCDHRPADCCVNSACRCNLWGANCRCQRRGIFQKWGK